MAKKIIVQEGNTSVNAMTTWINPSEEEVCLRFFDENGRKMGDSPDAKVQTAIFSQFVIQPKEEMTIPSKYNHAVQRIRNGYVVAGQGPQLQKKGEKKIPLHKSIDPDQATKAAQVFHAKKILENKIAADEALMIASAELVEKKSKKEKEIK